jgi:hypothetical protein
MHPPTNDDSELMLSLPDWELAQQLAELPADIWSAVQSHLIAYRTPKERAETSLHEFLKQAWDIVEPGCPFIDTWHIRAICEHLEAVSDGRIVKLVINVPPGCCKSLLVCVFWPMWLWGPHHSAESRWLFVSYGERLSVRDSIRCRNILKSDWYQRNWGDRVQLSCDQNERFKFENTRGGWRIATSVGGEATGEHPDFIVADDVHKPEEAKTELGREAVLSWWSSTVASRGIARHVRQVVIMHRLHRDDLAGFLLNLGGWDHICLPMRYEATAMKRPTSIGWTDPRTVEGELLCPVLIPEEVVREKEAAMGLDREGQLQQRPPDRSDSALFHASYFDDQTLWFDQWPTQGLVCKVVACDPKGAAPRRSNGRASVADFCARVRVALHQSGTLYVDATLDHTDITEASSLIFRDALEFLGGFPVVGIAVEANFGQILVAYELGQRLARAGALMGIHGITHTTNKFARIQATLNWQLANSRLRFKRGSSGAALLVEQLKQLPNGRFDDGPDALEMAVTIIRQLTLEHYEEAA